MAEAFIKTRVDFGAVRNGRRLGTSARTNAHELLTNHVPSLSHWGCYLEHENDIRLGFRFCFTQWV